MITNACLRYCTNSLGVIKLNFVKPKITSGNWKSSPVVSIIVVNVLINEIIETLNKDLKLYKIKLNYKNQSVVDYIYTNTQVLSRENTYDCINISYRSGRGVHNKIKKMKDNLWE